MNDIFDKFKKRLPPTHQNPQKAITEQVLYNSEGIKDSDMLLDNDHFRLPIGGDTETLPKPDQKTFDQSFFKLD